MRLEDLRIFLTIIEEGTINKAATRLAMTQPGVSQHLATLEEELKKKLFDRVGNRVELNEFGRLFVNQAKDLLLHAEKVVSSGLDVVIPSGFLRIGVTDSSTMTVIPKALLEFKKLYPNIRVRLDVDDSLDIEYGIARGHYDIGVITGGLRPHPNVLEESLYCDRIDALVSKKHILAKKQIITLEELSKWPLLVYPRQSRTRKIIDEVFRKNNIAPKEITDVYISTAAVKLSEIGMGVSLLSKAFITSEMLKHKCAHIRIKNDPFVRNICAVIKQGAHLTEQATAFYNLLIKHKTCELK